MIERHKAYIVKYWETTGIYEAAVEMENGCVREINAKPLLRDWLVIGVDATLSKEAAESLTKLKIAKKIAKLEAEVNNLEAMHTHVRTLWK